MQAQIQKWGNSLGVRIPKDVASRLHIKDGAIVNIAISENNLVITPKISELDLLLNDITADNLHYELLSNDDTSGNESW
jgi:antitoxin MazE